jgi:hypothetical protein
VRGFDQHHIIHERDRVHNTRRKRQQLSVPLGGGGVPGVRWGELECDHGGRAVVVVAVAAVAAVVWQWQ